MQLHFTSNFSNSSEILSDHERNLETKLSPLTKEIIESNAKTKIELEGLYNKIVTVIVLR